MLGWGLECRLEHRNDMITFALFGSASLLAIRCRDQSLGVRKGLSSMCIYLDALDEYYYAYIAGRCCSACLHHYRRETLHLLCIEAYS